MIISSYAKVATKILKYLNDCYENGLEPNIGLLNANMLGRQYYQTLNMLSDDGYIKGIELLEYVKQDIIFYNSFKCFKIFRLSLVSSSLIICRYVS